MRMNTGKTNGYPEKGPGGCSIFNDRSKAMSEDDLKK